MYLVEQCCVFAHHRVCVEEARGQFAGGASLPSTWGLNLG